MNPAANTATSAGIAGAAVEVIDQVLAWCHVAPPPVKFDEALGILITAAAGYYLHRRTQDPSLGLFMTKPKAAPAAIPSPQAQQ